MPGGRERERERERARGLPLVHTSKPPTRGAFGLFFAIAASLDIAGFMASRRITSQEALSLAAEASAPGPGPQRGAPAIPELGGEGPPSLLAA